MPIRPGRLPAAARIAKSRNVVVVLPFVPVTPTTCKLLRRAAEELVCGRCHRGARVGDDELRHVDVEPPLDHEGDRARLDGGACEIVPVGVLAANAEEQGAGPDRARVVREIGHLDRSAPDDVDRPDRGGEALEIRHRPASLAPPSGGSAPSRAEAAHLPTR